MLHGQRNSLLVAALLCGLGVLALTGSREQASAASESASGRVERGKYLVTILGCNDCHTPFRMGPNGPEPDMTRMLSGHPEGMKLPPPPKTIGPWIGFFTVTDTAFAGPWGISYASNLTPDQNTGLGIWTEEMFLNAIRTGKHMGTSRAIQPPMPWIWFGKMTGEDLKAVYAYLRTIPPIVNHVPDWEPPAPAEPPAPKK
jgi:hypothetical protein